MGLKEDLNITREEVGDQKKVSLRCVSRNACFRWFPLVSQAVCVAGDAM